MKVKTGPPTQYGAQYGRQQHSMDAKSTLWMPTAQYEHQLMGFLRKFAKKSSERQKTREERRKKSKNSLPIDLSNSDSYWSTGSPM